LTRPTDASVATGGEPAKEDTPAWRPASEGQGGTIISPAAPVRPVLSSHCLYRLNWTYSSSETSADRPAVPAGGWHNRHTRLPDVRYDGLGIPAAHKAHRGECDTARISSAYEPPCSAHHQQREPFLSLCMRPVCRAGHHRRVVDCRGAEGVSRPRSCMGGLPPERGSAPGEDTSPLGPQATFPSLGQRVSPRVGLIGRRAPRSPVSCRSPSLRHGVWAISWHGMRSQDGRSGRYRVPQSSRRPSACCVAGSPALPPHDRPSGRHPR
jgi:hypothetical protein